MNHCFTGIGDDPDDIFIYTAPCDVDQAVDGQITKQAYDCGHIYNGGFNQFFPKGGSKFRYLGCHIVFAFVKKYFPDQGESIGMDTGRGKTDEFVSGTNIGPVNDFIIVHDPHRKSGKIIVSGLVKPWHFGCFPADEGTSCLVASSGNTLNNLLCHLIIQGSHGQIIQKKQGLCSLDNDVVDTHGHKVNTNGVMLAHLDGYLQLGSHTVCGADQYRI